ncbi:MAG: serpin family protein [Pontiella sp.]
MKKLLLASLVFICLLNGYSKPIPADTILEYVRTKLPSDPIKLTGTLKVRTKNGFTKSNLPVEMELDWGGEKPTANYRIGEESLQITWNHDVPNYNFSNGNNTPTATILGTGITWADLTFSVLWWPNSELIDEEKKINRESYVVDVPVPNSENTMRLWIEKKMGMLLEAQTLDAKKNQLRRLKIKSIKKMDGMWVAKDLEIQDKVTGSKTTLQITDLEWKNPKSTAAAFDPASSVNQFTLNIYKQLSGEKGNLFLSPYSISSALAMVYGGARSDTALEMENVFHFGGQGATHPAYSYLRKKLTTIQDKNQIQLHVANSLWPQVDYNFIPDYLAMTREFYGSEIVPVDFKSDAEGARQKINGWVEDQTNDRIKDLIPEDMLDPMTRLVLANAIYFKGNWAKQFKAETTRPAPFILNPGNSVEVPMMSQTSDFNFSYNKTFQALELPYEGDDLSMLVLLPTEADGLPALERSLTPELITDLQFNKQEVMVFLPKFKLEWDLELSKTLAAMGMPLPFSEQADLSGMDGTRNLFIGAVVHKAFVEVNEEGTEAAAATAVGIRTTSMPLMFEANRPFLFLIRENSTGTILFIGRVTNPLK